METEVHVDKNEIRKKIRKKDADDITWRNRKLLKKEQREQKLLRQMEAAKKLKEEKERNTVSFDNDEDEVESQQTGEPIAKKGKRTHVRPYSLSIAVPGSFLNNGQSAELRSYMAGQVARSATLFCVEEIVVYDETARMTQEQADAYWGGTWVGEHHPSDKNIEGNFCLAKILEYMECPQYLRRALFPFHKSLRFAGLLNPLDAEHHLKATDLSIPYREGVILDKSSKKGKGPLVDIGLPKELQLDDVVTLPPHTRVTVEMTDTSDDRRLFRGKLSSAKKVRAASGAYWGYNVRIAKSLSEVLDRRKYDVILGTSPRGQSLGDWHVNMMNSPRILVVFGGVGGVEVGVEADETLSADTPERAFDRLVNPLPRSGSRSERVEENVLITLSELSLRMQQLS